MFNLRRIRRQAIHGQGDLWTEVGPSTAPSSFSAPTMNWSQPFGGRWRTNMPGSGDHHINDDSDKVKNTRGTPSDFDPKGKEKKINDAMDSGAEKCVVVYYARDGEDPKKSVSRLKGGLGLEIEPKVEGNKLVVEIDGLTMATRVQALLPGAVITIKEK